MNTFKIKNERIVAIATLALVIYTLALTLTGPVTSAIQENSRATISNIGAVKMIGVGVYWNSDGTNMVSSINWGTLEPGTSTNRTCYIQNKDNSVSTLSLNTTNWNPSNASDYISLNWDYDGQSINPGDLIPVIFTLSISDNIAGITSFSFDITIIGSE